MELLDHIVVKDGDTLILRENELTPASYMKAMAIRDKYAEDGITVRVILLGQDDRAEQLPDEFFAEQGFLVRSRVREWIQRAMPLAYQSRMLYKFDSEFPGA